MTFDECLAVMTAIRRNQGTRSPLVRLDYGGSQFGGRVVRCDADPEHRERVHRPYGLLVLQDPGLANRPDMMFQIADLVSGAIRDAQQPDADADAEDSSWAVPVARATTLRHAS
jgi:hypothetical protein